MVTSYLEKVGSSKTKLYPNIEYFLGAMRIKFVSTQPKLFTSMGYSGDTHQAFAVSLKEATPFSEKQFGIIEEESAALKKYVAKLNKSQKIQFNDIVWNEIRSTIILFAIRYRFQHDKLFQHIIQTLADASYVIDNSVSGNNAQLESGKVKSAIANAIIAITGLGDATEAMDRLFPTTVAFPSSASSAPLAPLAPLAPSVAEEKTIVIPSEAFRKEPDENPM
jgi:hypothetical protein